MSSTLGSVIYSVESTCPPSHQATDEMSAHARTHARIHGHTQTHTHAHKRTQTHPGTDTPACTPHLATPSNTETHVHKQAHIQAYTPLQHTLSSLRTPACRKHASAPPVPSREQCARVGEAPPGFKWPQACTGGGGDIIFAFDTKPVPCTCFLFTGCSCFQ